MNYPELDTKIVNFIARVTGLEASAITMASAPVVSVSPNKIFLVPLKYCQKQSSTGGKRYEENGDEVHYWRCQSYYTVVALGADNCRSAIRFSNRYNRTEHLEYQAENGFAVELGFDDEGVGFEIELINQHQKVDTTSLNLTVRHLVEETETEPALVYASSVELTSTMGETVLVEEYDVTWEES